MMANPKNPLSCSLGGINAALDNAKGTENDTWQNHALNAVIELEHMYTVFSRTENGKIAQRKRTIKKSKNSQ